MAKTAPGVRPVDVLILTALDDELSAVRDLGPRWTEHEDPEGLPYHRSRFDRGPGLPPLEVAAAWLGRIGRVTAAVRGTALLKALDPPCVAMCGICAGKRGATGLGDVIIADKLYSYDEGKLLAHEGKDPEIHHEIRTHELHPLWAMKAAYLRRNIDLAPLQEQRPPSRERQQRWLLDTVHAHAFEGGPEPRSAGGETSCPDLKLVAEEAMTTGLLTLEAGVFALTAAGRERVLNQRALNWNKLPDDPPFRVHVGTIGTGAMVQRDPGLFERLCRQMSSTIGVEMEGSAIGALAQHFDRRGVVVKAVSDHGDTRKDDSFRKFACRASAEVLMAFLMDLDPAELRRGDAAPPTSPASRAPSPPRAAKDAAIEPAPSAILVCTGVWRQYAGDWRLPKISLTLHHGRILGVVGENGAGKTTLLRILARDLAPTAGTITIGTADREGRPLLNQLTFVPQSPPPFAGTLREHLRQQAAFFGYDALGDAGAIATRSNAAAVRFAVEPLDLADQLDKSWAELSGGWRVRAAIAAALVAKPGLLLLDEPLAPLDPLGQSRLLGALWSLSRAHSVAIIMSSQHVPELEQVADEMLLLHDGRAERYVPRCTAPGTIFEVTLERTEHADPRERQAWSTEIETRLGELRASGAVIDARFVEGRLVVELPAPAAIGRVSETLGAWVATHIRDITHSALAVMYGVRRSMDVGASGG